MWRLILIAVCFHIGSCGGTLCPKECDCDMDNRLNRAMCVDQNIVSVDVGVPKEVQVYSLSRNVISELDNFCFKEIGYSSLIVLDLSNNLIFWIGLHAFAGLNHLTNLDLSNNRLRLIASDVFWDTPNLEILDLSSNVFEKVNNEPFIMHENLQVLNLNNCRIKSLPERLFSRLPKLKKLDLSDNYIVTITIAVLKPLRKLERLELRNEYWQCNPDFIAVETWILVHSIKYEKQCKKKSLKKSEKMISMVVERESVDIDRVWNMTAENKTLPVTNATKPLTPFQKFDRDFSAVQAFVIGAEIGLAIGIVGTYLWLTCYCSCGKLFSRPQARGSCREFLSHNPRRRRRNQRNEGDIRANLLWNNVTSPDLETPPLYRRQISLPERNPPLPIYGIVGLQVDAIRDNNRAETPPPPYNECRLNI